MPLLDSDFFSKGNITESQTAMIVLKKSNDAFYDSLLVQSQIIAEIKYDNPKYNPAFANMLAASNFSFYNTNGFNQNLPSGLPLETVSVVYRGRIYKNGSSRTSGEENRHFCENFI